MSREPSIRTRRLPRCVKQDRSNIFGLEIGQLLNDFFRRQSVSQQFKDIEHTDAHPTDARLPAALFRIDRDTVKDLGIHWYLDYRSVVEGAL
jgi:hypothetical protein